MSDVCNYIKFKGGIVYDRYAYFDASNYYADVVFINNRLDVRFTDEYSHPDYPYHVIFCKVKKKEADIFKKCMSELVERMIKRGYTDYPEFCKMMQKELEKEKIRYE